MRKIILALLLFLPISAFADENRPLSMAVADIKVVAPSERTFTRYLIVTPYMQEQFGIERSVQATILLLHDLSRSVITFKPMVLREEQKEGYIVIRYNIKDLVLDQDDAKEVDAVTKAIEQYEFEPALNRFTTKATLELAAKLGLAITQTRLVDALIDVPVYEAKDEKGVLQKYNQKRVKKEVPITLSDVEVIREFSEHIDKTLLAELIDATQSQAALVTAPYFFARVRTIRDELKGKPTLRSTLYGGLYNQLAGIAGNEKDLLKQLGVLDPKIFDKQQTDRRAWLKKSGITGSERLIEFLPVNATPLGTGRSLFVATRDVKRDSIDVDKSFRLNVAGFKEDGSELIWGRGNGLLGYAAENAERVNVEQVPDTIASDRTRPDPHPAILEAPWSCKECHRKEGGHRKIKSSLKELIDDGRFKFSGDIGVVNQDQFLRRLKGWAGADLEEPDGVLPRDRDDLARAIMRITGPWGPKEGGKEEIPAKQTDIVNVAHGVQGAIFNSYTYEDVGAYRALREMGYEVKNKAKAADQLDEMLGRPSGVIDGRVKDLIKGDELRRSEFDLVRSFLILQINQVRQAQKKGEAK